ncbi:inositol monophosphatase [bacterium CPR1]|nr:inositol monophosphatase [bacterium CPR1]
MLNVAESAARAAGELIRQAFAGPVAVRHKGAVDLVTEVDTACEALIRTRLLESFPHHGFLGEEGGVTAEAASMWIVDPLDGTTNFAHGYPFVAVSIGLEVNGVMELGVVYDPLREELFNARRGEGARLNGRPIAVSERSRLEEALLVTGFPYSYRRDPERILALFRAFSLRARGMRRDGAAALDLCYLACGRFDGFYELGLAPWDTAAGSLIVNEAGGMLTDLEGKPFDIRRPSMLASNVRLHKEMRDVVRQASCGH